MKKLTFTLFLLVITTLTYGQSLKQGDYFSLGIEYGVDAGLGGYISYDKLSTCTGCPSIFQLSFLYKDDGVDTWGEDYTGDVGQNQFTDDIVDEGYYNATISGAMGFKITKGIHLLGILGYQANIFVQQRRDPSRILADNGKYHTRFRDGGQVGIGSGLKFFIPVSLSTAITPMLQYTTLKGISFSLGVAF